MAPAAHGEGGGETGPWSPNPQPCSSCSDGPRGKGCFSGLGDSRSHPGRAGTCKKEQQTGMRGSR